MAQTLDSEAKRHHIRCQQHPSTGTKFRFHIGPLSDFSYSLVSSHSSLPMLSFATEFPVSHANTLTQFMASVRQWVLGSPHTVMQEADLEIPDLQSDWSLQKANERIGILYTTSPTEDAAAARYSRVDGDLEWTTTIVFSRQKADSWVGVRVECESLHPAVRLPPARKPVVVRTILQTLGEARDGSLTVASTPHVLRDIDIDLAARLVTGKASCRLPIVYVSSSFAGIHHVDARKLANDLAGMAHVVVEPNRAFSLRLQIQVDSENVYGGTVGIYWPEGAGRRSFFLGGAYSGASDLHGAIVEEIRSALVNRRPLDRCTELFPVPWTQGYAARVTSDAYSKLIGLT